VFLNPNGTLLIKFIPYSTFFFFDKIASCLTNNKIYLSQIFCLYKINTVVIEVLLPKKIYKKGLSKYLLNLLKLIICCLSTIYDSYIYLNRYIINVRRNLHPASAPHTASIKNEIETSVVQPIV
jgi:hypothetical protein